MKHILLVAVVIVSLALPVAASAQEAAPLNYCTTVEAIPTGATYTVNATGAGRYARLVEYPIVGAPVIVAGPTDFGLGATVYQWTGVNLAQRQYQVQMSHTSLTAGYSSTGCVFTPPPPLVNQIDAFMATCTPTGARLDWQMISEAGITYYTINQLPAGAVTWHEVASIPSNCPGCMGGASYSYEYATASPNGTYELTDGITASYVTVDCPAPTAVRLSSFGAKARHWWQR